MNITQVPIVTHKIGDCTGLLEWLECRLGCTSPPVRNAMLAGSASL